MAPATFSSGMLQINVWTDLFFASFIPNAAAAVSAMGYAGLLIQTPLGILSSVILVPLFPVLSKLTDPKDWGELKQRIRQGLILTALTMLPLSALMITLALPITRLVYERGAFNAAASELTASVLMAYAIGMFVYLGRDILIRVFYALGDADTPFRISIVNIFLNALFDYLLVQKFGAPGLVLATVGVNITSMAALLWFLDRRLNGLPWKDWSLPILGLMVASLAAGLASWATLGATQNLWGSDGIFQQLVQLGCSTLAGLLVFGGITWQMKLPEVEGAVAQIKQKFFRS
jgi:putative peptidoglycan lipid II flippase